MEFYKVIYQQGQYQLEEEAGQDGTVLDNGLLSRLAALLYSCYQQQEQLPLTFRRYLDRLSHQWRNGVYCAG